MHHVCLSGVRAGEMCVTHLPIRVTSLLMKQISFLGFAHGAVHFEELFLVEIFGALENFAGLEIDVAHLVFLLVGHGHDAEGENLVDFAPVEEGAGAFRGDLGIIVEDDREEIMVSRSCFSSSPTRTGQVPICRQEAAVFSYSGGGSSWEMNSAP